MSDIDWSKASDDFPLWLEGLGEHAEHSGWYRRAGDVFEHETHGQFRAFREGQFFTVHHKPEQLAWNGEGQPPVGLRCEAGIPHVSGTNNEIRSVIWIEGRVIAYHIIKGKTYAWFAEDDGFYPPGIFEFRPIRTPEQILHDEAMEEVPPIYGALIAHGLPRSQEAFDAVLAMWKAGYRKPEIVDE